MKVEENFYMMLDCFIVVFFWDVIFNCFWGCGVCEKGYNSQKVFDIEFRVCIDVLVLIIYLMMVVDVLWFFRGMKFEVRLGKMFLINGNFVEVL